eukprot:COSAG02_NODE_736_length_17865_cov_9.190420_12_plen_90_part_00
MSLLTSSIYACFVPSRAARASERREVEKHCEIGLPQRRTSSEISQIVERVDMPAAQASFVRCICGVDKRQESSEDACRPCDRSRTDGSR